MDTKIRETNIYTIIAIYRDGLATEAECVASLALLNVRGAFKGLDFIGYDYVNQAWLKTE